MEINGFTLVNSEKVQRAIYGSMSSQGQLAGGVGEDASDEAKIAEYDRLGGLIQKGKYKVKTGAFYDFEKKAPRKTPVIVYQFRDVNDELVEVADGEELPLEVKAAEQRKEKKAKTARKGKKTASEDDEDGVDADEETEDDE